MTEIILTFRGWVVTVTDHSAVAEKADGSGERFECHRQPSAEDAMRAAVRKVERIEGPQVWIKGYTDEALYDRIEDETICEA